MPEITSAENIRAKLREFEERVDGAVVAAKTLARIKVDAEKLLADIQGISMKSEQSLQKVESVRLQFQQLQRDWDELKKQVDIAQFESKETRDLVVSELDAAVQSLSTKVAEAEERLKTTNRASLADQAELLKGLDSSTRKNAETAASAKSVVMEKAENLGQLLGTLRDELQSETRTKLLHAEELLDTQLKEIEQEIQEKLLSTTQTLTTTAGNIEKVVREQMDSFKQEMKDNLSEHQQASDRQLTDFLNKQNALVQNLNQQIDSYNRSSQTQSTELTATNTRISEVASAFNAYKTTIATELSALSGGIGELKGLLADVQTSLTAQDRAHVALNSSLQTTAARLDKTLDKLKQLPLVGCKFK
jgi:chromosome segregation ATPase